MVRFLKSVFRNKGLWIIYIAGMLLLLCLAYACLKNPYYFDMPLDGIESDYGEFDGNVFKANDAEIDKDMVRLLKSDAFELPRGSYTLSVSYSAQKQQRFELKVGDGNPFLHANRFDLSKNKKYVNYHFYTTQKINNTRAIAFYNGDGDFCISRIEIRSNIRCYLVAMAVLTILFAVIILFFRCDWMVRNRKTVCGIVAISLLGSIGIFMKGQILTHDYGFHLARIEGIAQGIKCGQFPVRMETSFNDGYGYPVSVFYGDILLYIPAVARIVGFSLITSYKIYVYITNLLTTIICYYSAVKIFKKQDTAMIVSLSYVMANYRFVDVYGRTAVGEYTALMFYPLIFMAMYKLYFEDIGSKFYKKNAYLLAFGMAGLLYSHLLSLEMVTFSLLLTVVLLWRKTCRKETMLALVKSVCIFILLGLSFLIPFIDYYVNTDIIIKSAVEGTPFIQQNGAFLSDYFAFFRKYTGSSDYNINSRMQFTPGMVLMGTLILSLFLIVNRKADNSIKGLAAASVMALILASNIFPWDNLSYVTKVGKIMAQIQFPWRYLGIAIVLLSFLLGFILESNAVNRNEVSKVIVVTNIFMAGVFISIYDESFGQNFCVDFPEMPQYTYGADLVSGLGASEYLMKGTDIENLDYWVVADNADAWIEEENGLNMVIHVEANDNAYVEVPRFNYKNYVVYDSDYKKYEIITGTNNKVRIKITQAYNGTLYLDYKEPILWRLSELLSLATFACLMLLGFRGFTKRKHYQNC